MAYHQTDELRNIIPPNPLFSKDYFEPNSPERFLPQKEVNALSKMPDGAVQSFMGERMLDTILINYEGISNESMMHLTPPDTDGDVGPDHYFQMVNYEFAIWDKQGNLLYGPASNMTLFSGLGINAQYDCDPIVLYDHLADRWLISSMAHNNYVGPNYILIALSESPDPLGQWYAYAFEFDDYTDYPKFGVWPDGYYMTANQFKNNPSLSWAGSCVAVFNRESMINGQPDPEMVFFDLEPTGWHHFDPINLLPAELDGEPPPKGTPNYLCYFKDDTWGFDNDFLSIWKCEVNWENIDNSSLSEMQMLLTEPFDSNYDLDSNYDSMQYITQPYTIRKLQSLGDKLMYSMKYRHFGYYGAMVTNHTVDFDGNDHAGIRWYELRVIDTTWTIYQQGTYAPDTNHRWMGSIAIDRCNNIALGYSVSSDNIYPSIRLTGRYRDDPLGMMSIIEQEIATGAGYQLWEEGRWGDYSMMTTDPIDEMTFWYTQEYTPTNSYISWYTRIAAFRLQDTCIMNNVEEPPVSYLTGLEVMIIPNPFTTSTILFYTLEKASTVTISIFNPQGQLIDKIEQEQPKGEQHVQWNAKGLPAGMYYFRIQGGNKIGGGKIIKVD